MFKLASFPTWVTGSAFQLVSFPPAWPLKWTSILQKQTLYSANLIIALLSWSSGSSFLQFRRQLMSLAHILSLSLSSVHFLLRTDTLEIETWFFRTMLLFFSLYPFIFRFLLKFLFAKNALLFYYSKKFSAWFFVSLSLSLHFCLCFCLCLSLSLWCLWECAKMLDIDTGLFLLCSTPYLLRPNLSIKLEINRSSRILLITTGNPLEL